MSIVNHIRCWLFAGVTNCWKLFRQPYKHEVRFGSPIANIIDLSTRRRITSDEYFAQRDQALK